MPLSLTPASLGNYEPLSSTPRTIKNLWSIYLSGEKLCSSKDTASLLIFDEAMMTGVFRDGFNIVLRPTFGIKTDMDTLAKGVDWFEVRCSMISGISGRGISCVRRRSCFTV